MNSATLYLLTGGVMVVVGLYHLLGARSVFRKILAANVQGVGIFMILVALAAREPDAAPDPVPHAMVLTGIVVSVCATALALKLTCRLHLLTGGDELPESDEPDDGQR